jgi:hypothetical protein
VRDWLYGRLLVRKFVSLTIAPGGVGKSSLIVVEALAMITACDLLGVAPIGPRLKVWLWNLEDPIEETERKIHAALIHYGIKREDTDGLFVNSGRDEECEPLVIAKKQRDGVIICKPVVDDLVKQIKELEIDVLVIDPFVSCHEVEENANSEIDQVAKLWSRVADLGNCAVHLVHHTRKAQAGIEVTAESARGAKALTDAARVARAINQMSVDEGKKAGIENPRMFFRTFNDKANLAPPMANSDWFKLESVSLGNGPFGLQGDSIGVVVKWTWPDYTAGITGTDFDKVAAVVRAGKWRGNMQAKDWVGKAVAQALGLVLTAPGDKAKVVGLVNFWLSTGALVEVEEKDEHRKTRTFIEVRNDR